MRRIEQRNVIANQSRIFQALDARQAGRGREVDPLGKRGIGHFAVTLQFAEDFEVYGIQFHKVSNLHFWQHNMLPIGF